MSMFLPAMRARFTCFLGSIFLLFSTFSNAQQVSPEVIKSRIEFYKTDSRGPYKDIRWFCKDGTTLPPPEHCPEPDAVQRARMKDDVLALAKSNHIYLGQILSTTKKEDFWDEKNGYSQIKQYQLGKYLQSVDDGWVNRKGQFYRGAFQVEDEEAWGIDFYKWLLTDDRLNRQFFFIRQTTRDIPHRGDNDKTLQIRAESKTLSEDIADFMDLRVKIHGQPESSDIAKVIAFRNAHQSTLTEQQIADFNALIRDMKSVYETNDLLNFCPTLESLSGSNPMKAQLTNFVDNYDLLKTPMSRAMALAENIMLIREYISSTKSTMTRLYLLDMSLRFEDLFVNQMSSWHAANVGELLDKICYSGMAATGAGFMEKWEWDEVLNHLAAARDADISLTHLQEIFETGRHLLEWGTGMVRANYAEIVNTYTSFEPLARPFTDDRIRSSALLPLGESVSTLGNLIAVERKTSNHVMDIGDQGFIRGLNPGYAKGQLVVISGDAAAVDIQADKIYVFETPPEGLKPIAGIATVSEGNLISHIQLLARNLGIPNMVLAPQNLNALKKYNGTEVFYAVSNSGTVIMKPVDQMSAIERDLFTVKSRAEEKINVPVDKLQLEETNVLDLRTINAEKSGIICGPKAANLGQLKSLFPDHVVDGIVIPFGIFKTHMNQTMPGQSISYWTFLQQTFRQAELMRSQSKFEAEVERYTLDQLKLLQEGIKVMKFSDDFLSKLTTMFKNVLGSDLGKLPVFVRSDTNMEDLKDFTGAGLNLTVFNVLDKEKILQAIRDVWASPYTERSYKWRQHYLLNPENVYPSILIIPTVNVECSGVMVTKGVQSGRTLDNTVAFSRGVGGAVDGQAAETYILTPSGESLLQAPAREPTYRTVPATGGSATLSTTFEQPILNFKKLVVLRNIAYQMRTRLPGTPGIDSKGPFDIELGFKDGILWLFQVRPFVENKNAVVSEYLESISSKMPDNINISLKQKL